MADPLGYHSPDLQLFDLRWQALTADQPARVARAGAAALPLAATPPPLIKQVTGYCDPLSAAPGTAVSSGAR
jgi:hypothetical protein